jgi:transcriptional antiterminator RfaH
LAVFEVYLPRYRKQRWHARRIDVVAALLFPRYLFVSIDLGAQRWHSIQSTIGIIRLVGNGDGPGMVSPETIEGLRNREDAEGLVLLEQRPRFSPSDRVRISDGAFCDCLGV